MSSLAKRFVVILAVLAMAISSLYPLRPLAIVTVMRKQLTKHDAQIDAVLEKAGQVPISEQWGVIKTEVTDRHIDLKPYFEGRRWAAHIPAQDQEQSNKAILNFLQRKASPKITLGLDLQGGTSYLVQLVGGGLETRQMDAARTQAINILRKRIDRFGVSEPIIQPVGEDRINIQIPGLSEQQREEARSQIERIAKLEFRLVHPQSPELAARGQVPPGYEMKVYRQWSEEQKKWMEERLVLGLRSELTGKSIVEAFPMRDQAGRISIHFKLDSQGAKKFAEITRQHVHDRLAVLLDGEVRTAPVIQTEISGGQGEITGGGAGGFDPQEAQDLAGVLNNPLETPVKILQAQDVEPSLGADSIKSGVRAGIIGLAIIAAFMAIYYLKAGLIADFALCFNIILMLGVLATFHFTLTLPGIAGLILTVGIAVDANVLVYERMRELLNAGSNLRNAVQDGFSRALPTIIDANMTTLITAAVLIVFGTGPVQGFGVVLAVGICTSLIAALFVTRFIFDWLVAKAKWQRTTMLSLIGQTDFNFVRWRWVAAAASILVIAAGMAWMGHKGKEALGVDFVGGDALTLRYKQKVEVSQLRQSLDPISRENSIQYESNNRLLIKTPYEKGEEALTTLQSAFPNAGFTRDQLERVGPTVGKELATTAMWSLGIASLAIVIYITTRFELAYAVGAVVALLHDVLVTLGVFLLCGRQITMPVIGALLTIGGYSLNDTVVVFDRIREEVRLKGDRLTFGQIVNLSVNRVLSRTLLTSLTTFIASFSLLVFGGGVINDFALILVVGVITGTYSSVYIASPILFLWHPRDQKVVSTGTSVVSRAEVRQPG